MARPGRRFSGGLLLVLVLGGCGDEPRADGAGTQEPKVAQPPTVTFDFGTLRHGAIVRHDFVLDTRQQLGPDFVALGVRADCSCARSSMLLRDRDGNERGVTGQPFREFLPREGERLVVRLELDTTLKEPVDLPPVESKAAVLLQDVRSHDASTRVPWPLLFRFAIDSPVTLRPFAVLDFGKVPLSRQPELLTVIEGEPEVALALQEPQCADPRLHVAVEPVDGRFRLRAEVRPAGTPGTFRVPITIATNLPDGYVIRIQAVGKIVPDLEVTPMDTLSIRTDLTKAQTPAQASSQYLIATDHDLRRAAEFVVARFVDAAGRDASGSFEVRLEPVPGDERSRRVFVRYLGGCDGEFRGELVLAKDPRDGPFLPVKVLAFHVPS